MVTSKCKGCGYQITVVTKFPTYCNTYCCGCCPDAHKSPCAKEKIFGTPMDNLKKARVQS